MTITVATVEMNEMIGPKPAEKTVATMIRRRFSEAWGVEVPEEQAAFRAWMAHYEATTYERTPEGPHLLKNFLTP